LADDSLEQTLTEAQRLGFLGPAPVASTIDHAHRFVAALPPGRHRLVDLGSGGGVPGLVLAVERPELDVVLLDASERRTTWLARAVARLGLGERIDVVTGRAEQLGRLAGWRGRFDAVVARGFGAPSVTAECAAPLLRVGGALIVSEPPGDAPSRWDAEMLAALGLAPTPGPDGLAVFHQVRPCPDRFPRARPR
jgi:16S rRNA (guanine527-N7)-methyltransferase